MKETKAGSISLPAAQWTKLEARAEKEGRTISEIVSEALRPYLYERDLAELRARRPAPGVTEADVVPLIHEFRQERRNRKVKRPA